MRALLCTFLLIASSACTSAAQEPSHFAVVWGPMSVGGGDSFYVAHHLLGRYERGRFVEDGDLTPQVFPTERPLRGLTEDGRQAAVTIDRVWPGWGGGYYEPSLVVTIQDMSLDDEPPITLFTTSELQLHGVDASPATLDSASWFIVENELNRLWTNAIEERAVNNRPDGFSLGEQRIVRLDDLLVIWLQAVIGRDRRGSFFLIYSAPDRRIIYSTFGHGEWSPSSNAILVVPHIFFRIGSDPVVYLLARRELSWEDFGFAILDLQTGSPLLQTGSVIASILR